MAQHGHGHGRVAELISGSNAHRRVKSRVSISDSLAAADINIHHSSPDSPYLSIFHNTEWHHQAFTGSSHQPHLREEIDCPAPIVLAAHCATPPKVAGDAESCQNKGADFHH